MFSSPSFQGAVAAISDGHRTDDSFQNFQLQLGMGTDNALSGSTYGFNPITRNRTLLEFMYRGSWLAGAVINLVAEDMTRAGIEVTSDMDPRDIEKLHAAATTHHIWSSIEDAECWARLYGGSIAVILIDGQDMSSPLKVDSVGRGQFRGLLALDRWMVEPSSRLISDMGPEMGLPYSYRVGSSAPGLRGQNVHHSRCLRLEGIRMPYTQRMMENLWGISVLERLYDRMVAFDSATTGAAQLVYKSYIRTYRIKDLRKSIAGPPEVLNQILQYVQMMRRFQGIEGITLLDSEDEFESQQGSRFTGISDALVQFGQQLAGASQIPLVRLFGMSPSGFSATGESDLRTYYDGIGKRQERDLRVPLHRVYQVMARSEDIEVGRDFNYAFKPLWQLTETERAGIAQTIGAAVEGAMQGGVIDQATAMRELKQSSRVTGIFTNITDEDIQAAAEAPPDPQEMPDMQQVMQGQGADDPENGAPPPDPRQAPDAVMPVDRDTTPPRRFSVVRDGLAVTPGLEVVVENPRGTTRYPWRTQLPAHYGHIRGTDGGDGEECDCFIGPEPDAGHDVWAIDQVHPDTGAHDEWKLMIGFPSRQLALRAYQRSFDDGSGAARVGAVRHIPFDSIHAWLRRNAPRRAA